MICDENMKLLGKNTNNFGIFIESIWGKLPCVSDTTCEWHGWFYDVLGGIALDQKTISGICTAYQNLF